ncbi:MAG TPA: hypothetical protein VG755_42780 [Nannocystaceae bacterium]|nr:hypothetical protein [Nannocystaceae bacterium]
MKTSRWILLVAFASACTPPSKDAGDIVDSEEGSGSGESEGEGSASVSSTSATSASTTTTDDDGSGSDDDTTDGIPLACSSGEWADSLGKFQMLSLSSNGTYYYTRRSGGIVFGSDECTYETTISAAGSIIVHRSVEIIEVPEGWTEAECALQPYVEEGDQVGTNDEPYSVHPYTMEELYEGCCDLLAIEPAEEYDIGFGVDDIGVVSTCFATIVDCGEGCEGEVDGFSGFHLSEFAIAN